MMRSKLFTFLVAFLVVTGGGGFAFGYTVGAASWDGVVMGLEPVGDSGGYEWRVLEGVPGDGVGEFFESVAPYFRIVTSTGDYVYDTQGWPDVFLIPEFDSASGTDEFGEPLPASALQPISNDGTIPGWTLAADGLVYFADSAFWHSVLTGFLTESYFWLIAWPGFALLLAAVWVIYRKIAGAASLDLWVPGETRRSHPLARPWGLANKR